VSDDTQGGVYAIGPDGKHYVFPKGTSPEQVNAHFHPQPTIGAAPALPIPKPLQPGFSANAAAGNVSDLASGAVKGMGQTIGTVEGALSHVLPENYGGKFLRGQSELEGAQSQPQNTMEQIGSGAESVLEFYLGGEALKGLSIADKLGLAKTLAKHPSLGRVIAPALRSGTVAGTEALAKGATPGEAAKTGLGFAAGDAAIGAAGEGFQWIKGLTKPGKAAKADLEKAAEAMAHNKEVEQITNRKAALGRGVEEYSRLTKENADQVYAQARQSLNTRWNNFRSMMRDKTSPTQASDLIEQARAEYLRGSPGQLTVFNNLLKELGIGSKEELAEMGIRADAELPYETKRVHFSAINDRMAKGDLPGNIYKALEHVRNGLDEELTSDAAKYGLGDEYKALKKEEAQFRSDWEDPHGPLTQLRVLQKRDVPVAHFERYITGQEGDRIPKAMARYRQYGSKPYLAAKVRATARAAKALEPGELRKVPAIPPPPKSKVVGKTGRVVGKIAGAYLGGKVGHPFLGYAMGGEAGEGLVNAVKNRAIPPPEPEPAPALEEQ
jgi:hypothetical protein